MDRAQFLQGLRTGGPRSVSYSNSPLSANPTATRFASNSFQPQFDNDQFIDRFQNMNLNTVGGGGMPMTAGPDAAFAARLQQAQVQARQQQLMMMQAQAAIIASGGANPAAIEAQAVQLQMQMEIMQLQALQQQQLLLQNQFAQQQQQAQAQANQGRRLSELHQIPSTAGPIQQSFPDTSAAQTRTAAANQLRARAAGREASLLKASASDEQVNIVANPPMTAAIGGKFANRAVSSPLNPNAAAFVGRFNPDLSAAIAAATKAPAIDATIPSTPTYGSTTIISGGTSLGALASPNPVTPTSSYNGLTGYNNTAATGTPTKSDSAMSWRRGSTTPAAVGTPVQTSPPAGGWNKSPSPPLRHRSISPPVTAQQLTVSIANTGVSAEVATISPLKLRPSPLRFASPIAGGDVVRSGSPSGSIDGSANDNGSSKSSPTSSTPPSSAGSGALISKEREEASRKLYEGLGLGRPAPSFNPHAAPFAPAPVVVAKVEPIRQPLGPPGSVDELGNANFAARLRKKALGGLVEATTARREMACAGPVIIGA